MALTDKLTAIGDAVRGKTGESEKLTLDGMAEKIRSMPAPMQKITISGNISGLFSEKFMELYNNNLKDYVEFKDVQTCYRLIPSTSYVDTPGAGYPSGYPKIKDLSNITINCRNGYYTNSSNMFEEAKYLEKLPKLVNFAPTSLYRFFYGCESLQEIPESSYKDWDVNKEMSQSYMLYNCKNLRKAPIGLFKKLQNLSYSGSEMNHYPYGCFYGCKKLQEVLNFPFPKYLSPPNSYENPFQQLVRDTQSLSRFTFEAEAEGTVHKPYYSCTLDFTENVGYTDNFWDPTIFIANKRIIDAASYVELKNDPESWTNYLEYCKYNKTSAVETINSLPIIQAASPSMGSTFTIKFNGDAGSATDGGAINTMTEEEIAVATSRGWTVTFV